MKESVSVEPELNYYKLILEKVSFSRELFSFELEKAIDRLPTHQAMLLLWWVHSEFEEQFFPLFSQYYFGN